MTRRAARSSELRVRGRASPDLLGSRHVSLPLGLLAAYAATWSLGLSSNILSLGGIAIAIDAMIDAAIIMAENAHKHLERAPAGTPRHKVIIEATTEVGSSLFFSLLIITVSFLAIFAREGLMFESSRALTGAIASAMIARIISNRGRTDKPIMIQGRMF